MHTAFLLRVEELINENKNTMEMTFYSFYLYLMNTGSTRNNISPGKEINSKELMILKPYSIDRKEYISRCSIS